MRCLSSTTAQPQRRYRSRPRYRPSMTAPEDAELTEAELTQVELTEAVPDSIETEDDVTPPPSGVDAALRQRLDEIAAQPLGAQADAYQQIHTELQQSL